MDDEREMLDALLSDLVQVGGMPWLKNALSENDIFELIVLAGKCDIAAQTIAVPEAATCFASHD